MGGKVPHTNSATADSLLFGPPARSCCLGLKSDLDDRGGVGHSVTARTVPTAAVTVD